jgi:hypothetical protein
MYLTTYGEINEIKSVLEAQSYKYTKNLMFVVPYILVTYAFIQFQLDVLYALFLS